MKIFNIIFLSAAALMLAACGTSPEAKAEAFVQALHGGEAEKAIEHIDPGVREAWRPKLIASVRKVYDKGQRRGGLSKAEVLKSEVEEDRASVTVRQTFRDKSEDNITVKLREVDGDWYVTF